MSDNQALLAARGVTRRFGAQTALHPTELDVRARETLALVGPNGAGKSTLLAILAGSLDPNEGTVERRGGIRIGWTPQRPGHYGRLSARENLELFARLEGVAAPSAAAARLLEEFGLPDDGKPSGELSVGNRQRLNLALSLLGDPHVLLLDEPTTALDPRQRRRLWESTTSFKAEGGAVVFATQNLDEVARFADRVAVLLDGVVVFQGSHEEYEREGLAQAFA